jgi:hypothetical protein
MLDGPSSYQIRLRGHLSAQWAMYFEGFTLTNSENGEVLLTGVITDQAALPGVLAKIRDLGVPLLSVNPMAMEKCDVCHYFRKKSLKRFENIRSNFSKSCTIHAVITEY